MRLLSSLVLALLCLSGCASAPISTAEPVSAAAPPVVSSQSVSLPTQPSRCLALNQVRNTMSPADLYPEMAQCIQLGDYERAVRLFALAGVYGRYDHARVDNASDATQTLQLRYLGNLSAQQQEAFKTAARPMMMPGTAQQAALCGDIQRLGAPGYAPNYLISPAAVAVPDGAGTGLKAGFDVRSGWREAISGFLHCG